MQVTQPATDPTPIPLPGTATLLLAAILAWLIAFARRLTQHRNPRRLLAALLILAMLPAHAVERIEYIHSDPLGSPIAATDENGELLWRERYQPNGSRELKQAPARERLWFTGKAEETILGLQDFGARWYDPTAGRFISMDPVGFTESNLQSFNRYAFANNNPYRYVDPDGRYVEAAFEAASIAVGFDSLRGNIQAGNWGAATVDGLGLVADGIMSALPVAPGVVGLGIKAVRETGEVAATGEKTFQTYTKTNAKTGEVYCGRTSGCGTALENVANRDSSHHMNDKGFGPAILDKSSSNAAAIRGREQQMIEAIGGARSTGGTSGNAINGISPRNPNRNGYLDAARKEFGQ